MGSYSFQAGKHPWPYEFTDSENRDLPEGSQYKKDGWKWSSDAKDLGDMTIHDKKKGRIPIREIFVNTDTIIEAFKNNNTIKKVLEEIITKINEDSHDVFMRNQNKLMKMN